MRNSRTSSASCSSSGDERPLRSAGELMRERTVMEIVWKATEIYNVRRSAVVSGATRHDIPGGGLERGRQHAGHRDRRAPLLHQCPCARDGPVHAEQGRIGALLKGEVLAG